MLEPQEAFFSGEMESISYSNGELKKTVGGSTSKICDVVTSGFRLTHNNTTGADQFEAIGSAQITEDDTNGYDEFTF